MGNEVVVGSLDEVGHELGRVIEAVLRQPVPKTRESAGEQDDDEVAQIGIVLDAYGHDRPLPCMTSRCFAQ